MHETSNDRLVLSALAQNLLRILIASYFLAGAVGLIPGSDLTPLFGRLLPASLAGPVAASTVFLLAYLVMIGIWLRGAALLLGILTFWASYLRMVDLGMAAELGSFWRDLALIASLILTYAETDPRNHRLRSVVHRDLHPRRIQARKLSAEEIEEHRLRRPVSQLDPHHPAAQAGHRHMHDRKPISVEEMESIFREDLELVRPS